MTIVLQNLPFILELLFNGLFIALYSILSIPSLTDTVSSMSWISSLSSFLEMLVPIVIFCGVIINYLNFRNFELFARKYFVSLGVFVAMFISWGDSQFIYGLALVHLLYNFAFILFGVFGTKRVEKFFGIFMGTYLGRIQLKPAQIVLLSFSGAILIGSLLLALPISSKGPSSLSYVDALFMATSATCVTGLSTVSIASDFSLFGQMVILLLIQVGGLGIMTLSSSMIILMGRAMAMKDKIIMQDMLDVSSLEDLFELVADIVKYTFIIELWGGIILTIAFTFEGMEFGHAIYYGFFHSISAFCNAGFSLFDTSLESYATNPLIHGTVAVLVSLGGFGFIVLRELKEVILKKKLLARISMHSKIVLVVSASLTFSMALFIFFDEYLYSLDGYSLWEKIQISLFHSVTLRTAGFNTIPMTSFHSYTLYVMTLFMFVGASPGSTGGGIKTTSLAILFQSIVSTLKGRRKVTFYDRYVSSPTVVKVTALTFISILVICLFVLLIMGTEMNQSFLAILFEVISAFGTVGLSLGLTSSLSIAGKILISLLMLIGRIGPLTLVLAIAEKGHKEGDMRYPEGRLLIG